MTVGPEVILAKWERVRQRIEVSPHSAREAGDALAVLVPQLLDQLAAAEMKADSWATEAIAAAKCEETARAERDALGERCRQAEELLSYIVDRHDAAHESAINDPLAGELVEVIIQKDWRDDAAAWFRGDAARAALGDTPRGYDLTDDEAAEVLRASFGEPPQPDPPPAPIVCNDALIDHEWRPETEGT